EENLIDLDSLPEPKNVQAPDHDTLLVRQHAFGYTVEDLKMLMLPMAVTGGEAIGSMGTDTPLACLSDRPQLLYAYFKQLFVKAAQAVKEGASILVLSERGVDGDNVPIPSLLATAAVHHHLIREGTRTQCGLVIETGEAREVHHFCLLIGYGAGAINPYLAFETLADLHKEGFLPRDQTLDHAKKNYIKAANKGII